MDISINRRQFTAGATATLVTVGLGTEARATPLPWVLDTKVEVGGHNPQVSGGPVAASSGSELLSVYVGEGGKNLWYSYMNPALTWAGNQPITDPKFPNVIIPSDGRPALCYVASAGHFLLVVPGRRVFYTWQYAFAPWTQVDMHNDITELQFSQPALGDGGDVTHLLICDELGNLWWYRRSVQGGGWDGQKRVASGKSPSITSIGDTLHAIFWDTDQKAWMKATLPHGSSSWQIVRIVLKGPTPDQGATIVAFNGTLFVIYTANGSALQCSALGLNSVLDTPTPIKPNGHAAATNSPVGAASFTDTSGKTRLAVVHEGESSHNLWFTVTG